jgi:phosphoglycerol transferase MdoB-like AlkP superfamily enzyme
MHPYHANFFRRDQVFPLLHFNNFLDIAHFEKAPLAGPYVADAAVAEAILAALEDGPAQTPHFIFAMTMESHGPLQLETVQPKESKLYHTLGEDKKWAELTIYLRHATNADAALGYLLERLQARSRPTVLCFYGDHVPALWDQFRALGKIPKHSAYFIWRNFGPQPATRQNVPIEALGSMVLAAMQGYDARNSKNPKAFKQTLNG